MPQPAAPAPADPAELLGRERGGLMATLGRLDDRDWQRPTACPGWRVRDLTSHLWSRDLELLSWLGDGLASDSRGSPRPTDVATVDERNARWVAATRELSPQVLVDGLRDAGPRVTARIRLHPSAAVRAVAAAELAERFVHQQQLRAATGRAPYDDEEVVAAVVDTFAAAIPPALAAVRAEVGTAVEVLLAGGRHDLRRRWRFARGADGGWQPQTSASADAPAATMRTDAETFWRLLSGGLSSRELVEQVELAGTPTLFAALRDTRAVPV